MLKLSQANLSKTTVGYIVNMLSNDAQVYTLSRTSPDHLTGFFPETGAVPSVHAQLVDRTPHADIGDCFGLQGNRILRFCWHSYTHCYALLQWQDKDFESYIHISLYSHVFIAFLSRTLANMRVKTAWKSDVRIGIMNEIVNGIKVIKMYGWEVPFSDKIAEARK